MVTPIVVQPSENQNSVITFEKSKKIRGARIQALFQSDRWRFFFFTYMIWGLIIIMFETSLLIYDIFIGTLSISGSRNGYYFRREYSGIGFIIYWIMSITAGVILFCIGY